MVPGCTSTAIGHTEKYFCRVCVVAQGKERRQDVKMGLVRAGGGLEAQVRLFQLERTSFSSPVPRYSWLPILVAYLKQGSSGQLARSQQGMAVVEA